MGPIWYRVRSDVRAHAARAALLAAVIAVVSGLVLTLTAGVLRTASAPERYSAALGDDFDIALEQFSGRPRTAEVEALPAVAAVHSATFVFGGLVTPDEEQPVEAFVFAGTSRAFGAVVTDGREPDPAAPGEFVATESWLAAAGAGLGDELRLVTITQEQADELGFDVRDPQGPTLAATLVGVMAGPSELEDETPLALFPPTLLDAGDVGVASSVGVLALEPGATEDDLRAQLDALPDGDQFGLDDFAWVPPEVRTAVRAQAQGLAIVALIVAVAALAVLGQLLSRQVRLPAAQRLALGAMGLTRTQVAADPLGAAALPLAVGAGLGAVLAYAASGTFPAGFAARVEPDPGRRLDLLGLGFGAVVLVLLVVVWVLVALLLGGREGRAPHRPGTVELVAGRLPPGPAATGMRFALARHPRDPGSLRAPLLGLVLMLSVLVGAVTYGASVGRLIDEPARQGSDFDFATGAGGDEVPGEVRSLLEQDPDVEALTLFGTRLTSVGTTSLDVTGMLPLRGALGPDLLSGRLARTEDEIVLGRVAARELDVEVDDQIEVSGAEGPVTYTVTGLAVIPGVEGGDGIGEGGVVTLAGFRRVDPTATLGVAAVRLRAGATGAVERISEALGFEVGRPDRPSTIANLQRVRSTPFLVALSLGALVVLSLTHQLIMSARRRRRDLAVLRALGAERRWVTGVLHWQVTILTVVVAAVALPLGVIAGRLVYQAEIDRIGARTDLSVPFAVIAVLVLGLLALGNAAAAIPAHQARRERAGWVLADE